MENRNSPFAIKKERTFFYILAGIILLLYGRSLKFPFIGLDDIHMIEGNYAFIGKISSIPEAFVKEADYNPDKTRQLLVLNLYYRPMLTVSLILNAQIGGKNPFMYHVVNILLHIISCILVYRLFILMEYKRELAALTSLVYALHPLLVQAVAWVPGRNDSLLAVFVLAGMIYLIRYLKSMNKKDAGLHLFFLVLAFFTKESAIVFPFISLAYIFLFHHKKEEGSFPFKKYLFLSAAYVFFLVLFFLMREIALRDFIKPSLSDMLQSMWVNFPVFLQGIQKTLIPYNQSVMTTPHDTNYIAVILVILLISVMLALSKNVRWKYVWLGSMWFGLFLLPSLASNKVTGMEHRVYLPMAGMLMIIWEADFLKKFDLSFNKGWMIWIILLLFFIRSFVHVGVFRSWDKLWEAAAARNPHSAVVYVNYGLALFNQEQYDKALKMYMRAKEIDPREQLVHNNIGTVYFKQKKFDQAVEYFKKEIEINPTYAEAYYNLGLTYKEMGRKKEAAEMLKKALEINPHHEFAGKALQDTMKE